jgi:hypothetical protein
MEKILIKRPEKHYKPEIGDVEVYSLHQWLIPAPRKLADDEGQYIPRTDGTKILPLGYKNRLPWTALEELGIETSEILTDCTYRCCITDRTYTACVPFAILTKNLEKYLSRGEWRPWIPDMVRDQRFVAENTWLEVSTVDTLLLGTGYMDFIMPRDGSNQLKIAALDIGDGDVVLVWHFEWFNK